MKGAGAEAPAGKETEILKMAEVTRKIERRNPVHRSLHLLLTHLAIQQPEAGEDCRDLLGKLDDLFSKEADWEKLIEKQRAQQQPQQQPAPDQQQQQQQQ